MSLYSLIYVSYASRQMTEQDLVDILTVARRKNKELNVTGMLLYRDRFFIQALEGEKDTIDALYDTIANDPRHGHVLLVKEVPITERAFGDWSMGFEDLGKLQPGELEGFTDFLSHTPSEELLKQYPGFAHRMLNAFRSGGNF